MMNKGNIVSLDESVRKTANKRALNAKSTHIPGMLKGMRRSIEPILAGHCAQLFDKADDAFFDLAENAPNSTQQNIFFEAMRDARLKREAIAKDFSEAALVLLDYSVTTEGYPEFDCVSSHSCTGDSQTETGSSTPDDLSNLSIMDDDSVETMVAIDNMAKRFVAANGESLAVLRARFAFISGYSDEAGNDAEQTNPLQPSALCRVFAESCEQLNADIQARLVLYKLFEKHMSKCFVDIYRVANEHFIKANVLPQITAKSLHQNRLVKRPAASMASSRTPVVAMVAASSAPDEAHYLNATNGQLQGVGAAANHHSNTVAQGNAIDGDMAGLQLLSSLGSNEYLSLLNSRDDDFYAPELANRIAMIPSSASNPLSRASLLDYVHHAQCDSQRIANIGADQLTPLSPEQTISAVLQTIEKVRGRAAPLAARDRDIIGLVSILFKFIIDDRVVAEPMKAAISRMQLPIIKVALIDCGFFNDAQHPARQLLNTMTDATQGWIPGDEWQDDPLYLLITESVDRVINEFEQDLQVFVEVNLNLQGLLQQECDRAALREKRMVDAESSRDEQAASRARILAIIESYFEIGTPVFIEDMLRDAWSNWLYIIYHREGDNSAAWEDAIDTVRELLWTVAPARYAAHRHDILSLLPDVIKQLRSGFDAISYDRQRVADFFYQLEKLHLDILERSHPIELLDESVSHQTNSEEPASSGLQEVDELNSEDAVDSSEPTAEEVSSTVDSSMPTSASQATDEGGDTSADSDEQTDPQQGELFASLLARANGLSVGQWIEMHDKNGKKMRARLVAVLRNSGSRIFVNRSGVKAAELSVDEIAHQLQAKTITLLEDARLFDRALTSIIDNLRARKKAVQA